MTLWIDATIAPALWLLVKASALLALSVLVASMLPRRTSAAARHGLWMGVLVSLLFLPILSRTVPEWPLTFRVLPPGPQSPSISPPFEPSASQVVPLGPGADTPSLRQTAVEEPRSLVDVTAAWIYAAGVMGLLVYWLVQQWHVRQFMTTATVIEDRDWLRVFSECRRTIGISRPVTLLKSRERNVPMAFGTRHPAIVVPAVAETWDEDRRRAVLLHELAHVARLDCLTHSLALATCAVYWCHPAVWLIARRVRIERELACDDRVIDAGTEPREYASHLLEIAYSLGGRRAPALAVCMARPRQLEGRMLAALDSARNRRLPSTRVRIAGAALAVAVVAALAAARPAVTAADEAPPAADRHWPASSDEPTDLSVARFAVRELAVKKQVKEIAHLPLDGLKEARAAVRVAASLVGIAQENVPGTWEIRPTDTKGMVHLRIVELNSSTGTNVPIEQLEGLSGVQLTGAGGPVQFKVRRDAGTFTFEGVIRNGVGAGTFTFAADPGFPNEMVKRGFARPTATEQYQMARHDIGFAFVDELTKQGYGKPQTSELVRAGQHGVQAAYVREMAALGYRLGTLDPLVTLRDHGITPSYVRELADSGYKALPVDKLREARDHGITPEYIRSMRDAGYTSVPIDDLIKVRDHGVTPDYVRGLGDAGYRKLPIDQVVTVRDHGVTTEYVRDMRQLGYSLSIEELVRARDHGVTVEYVREMASLGYAGQSMDALIRVRDHGVTSDYAKDVKALGYDKLTLDDLVTLRDHGLTADRIRSANSRAGTRLPIDMLKSLAAGGMR
jgi:beta-lactamase regulating signal transducer with metallopeptidase domain/ribosomal protein L7Ae-like RNA K-turn-binding protein